MSIPPPPNTANSITFSALDIIKAALQEIGALAPGEIPSNEDSSWVLQKLQRLIDQYNAYEPMIFNVNFTQFDLVPNHFPYTIGPGADFDVIQRPIDIPSINLILVNTNTPVQILLNKRDEDWWAAQPVKNLTSTLPTDFYYSPDWPNGNIFLWPIPTAVNAVLIEQRLVLKQITNYNASFSMPPAYWDAVVYPLAESLCPSYERQASADLLRLSAKSVKVVEGNNIKSPRGHTGDAGMPGLQRRGDFNYYSGMPNVT